MKFIVAATGHRPDKLGGYGEFAHDNLVTLATSYLKKRRSLIGYVISGMALGWDQAWAEAAVALQIPFLAAVPFRGQESVWLTAQRVQYNWLLHNAFKVRFISPEGYSAAKMQRRNEWMVDHAQRLVALWDGSPGGTANCVAYAKKVKVPVTNLWDQYRG